MRSDTEAANTSPESVRIGPRRLRRYGGPSADTSYPLEYAFHLVGDVRDRTVVDLGCGSGTNSVLLAARGAQVFGVDISGSLLEIARIRARATGVPAPHFITASAHDLPIASGSVDLVFGIAVLHHLELDVVSREVYRVLRPGGRAIFQEPVRNSELIRRLRAAIPFQAADVSPFEHPLTNQELDEFTSRFVLRRQRAFSLPHINLSNIVPIVKNHQHKLHVIDRALLRRFSALERFAGIRVLEVAKD